jgi:hypothetical protein
VVSWRPTASAFAIPAPAQVAADMGAGRGVPDLERDQPHYLAEAFSRAVAPPRNASSSAERLAAVSPLMIPP